MKFTHVHGHFTQFMQSAHNKYYAFISFISYKERIINVHFIQYIQSMHNEY
jgi:hypothetical protein